MNSSDVHSWLSQSVGTSLSSTIADTTQTTDIPDGATTALQLTTTANTNFMSRDSAMGGAFSASSTQLLPSRSLGDLDKEGEEAMTKLTIDESGTKEKTKKRKRRFVMLGLEFK